MRWVVFTDSDQYPSVVDDNVNPSLLLQDSLNRDEHTLVARHIQCKFLDTSMCESLHGFHLSRGSIHLTSPLSKLLASIRRTVDHVTLRYIYDQGYDLQVKTNPTPRASRDENDLARYHDISRLSRSMLWSICIMVEFPSAYTEYSMGAAG